jgi:hypothetical protein
MLSLALSSADKREGSDVIVGRWAAHEALDAVQDCNAQTLGAGRSRMFERSFDAFEAKFASLTAAFNHTSRY